MLLAGTGEVCGFEQFRYDGEPVLAGGGAAQTADKR